MKRPVVTLALLASASLLIGCSSSTASTATEEEPVDEITETCEPGTVRGDVVEDELVQTEDGRVYCSVKLNPTGEIAAPYEIQNNEVTVMHGITPEHVAKAKVKGAEFLVETFFDDPLAGSPEEGIGTAWIENNSTLYGEKPAEELVSQPDRKLERDDGGYEILANDFFTLSGGSLPPLADNDGGSRIESLELTPKDYAVFAESQEVVEDPSQVRVRVTFHAKVTYRIMPTEYEAWRTGIGSDIYDEGDDEIPSDFSSVDLSGDEPAYLTVEAGHEDEFDLATQIPFSNLLDGELENAPVLFSLTLDARELAHN